MSNLQEQAPFGARYRYHGAKTGGANHPGKFGGVYNHVDANNNPTGKRSLFKQDTNGKKVRIAKVLGEAIGGKILAAWFNVVGVAKERYAEAKLAKASTPDDDKSGSDVYLESIFIDNYKEDFWKHAYRQHYQQQYRDIIAAGNPDEIAKLRSLATSRLNDELLSLNDEPKDAVFLKNAALLEAKLNDKIATYSNDTEALVKDAAEITVSKMKRPSAVFIMPGHAEVRKIISSAITENKATLLQFSQITASRLLVGDFGVHNGNFGVLEDGTLVCLDYGAAFCKLNPEVNPFTKTKTGTTFYKNHFLEYNDKVIKSPEMAMEFILVGRMSKEKISQICDEAVNELGDFADLQAFKKFAYRLGIKSKTVRTMNTEEYAMDQIKKFMTERLISRQTSMKNQGFALLLENCYANGEFNTLRFEHLLEENALSADELNELYQFANSRQFKRMNLVIHESHQYRVKSKIIAGINEHQIFSKNQEGEYNYHIVEIKNQIQWRLRKSSSESPYHKDDDQLLNATLNQFQNIMHRNNAYIIGKKTTKEYRDIMDLINQYQQERGPLPLDRPIQHSPTPPPRKLTTTRGAHHFHSASNKPAKDLEETNHNDRDSVNKKGYEP